MPEFPWFNTENNCLEAFTRNHSGLYATLTAPRLAFLSANSVPNSRTTVPPRQDISFLKSSASQKLGSRQASAHATSTHIPRSVPRDFSVEPFIRRIELWQHDNEHRHASQRAMTNSGRDDEALAFPDRNYFTVQFHLSIVSALQKEIRLRERLVIMSLSVFSDFCDMHRPRKLGDVRKRSASCPARTRHARDHREICMFPAAFCLARVFSHRNSSFRYSTRKRRTACTVLCRRSQESSIPHQADPGADATRHFTWLSVFRLQWAHDRNRPQVIVERIRAYNSTPHTTLPDTAIRHAMNDHVVSIDPAVSGGEGFRNSNAALQVA